MRLIQAVVISVLLSFPSAARAWGPEGHEVVAHLAALNLTPQARAGVASLLGGEAEAMMVIDSNWADEIRDARPETSAWHFLNLEIDGDLHYVPARDCADDNCVVGQIARDEAILKSAAPADQKAEALKFLIHFAGDVREPLHAGEDHDSGGNNVTIADRLIKKTSLHHFWDTDLVTSLGSDPAVIARGIDNALTPAQKAALMSGTPEEWAEDSAAISKNLIYARVGRSKSAVLQDKDVIAFAQAARLQLAKGGYGLAAMLNAIFR